MLFLEKTPTKPNQTKKKELTMQQQPTTTAAESKTCTNLSDFLVGVQTFADTNLEPLLNPLLSHPTDEDFGETEQQQKLRGPRRATSAMQQLLRWMLGRQDVFTQKERLDDFVVALRKCRVGLIKEFKPLKLSTSVSVGWAMEMFEKHNKVRPSDTKRETQDNFQPIPRKIGIVVNFGTGGGKATVFTQTASGKVQALKDVKPRNKAPSPNDCELGGYKPKAPRSLEQEKMCMTDLIVEVQAELQMEHCELGIPYEIVWVSAFVTGPLRAFICETGCPQTIEALHNYLEPVRIAWGPLTFPPGLGQTTSHALSQTMEAKFEAMACRAMYDTLSAEGCLPACQVVDGHSSGIGQGSTQLFLGLSVNHGMKHFEKDPEYDSKWLQYKMHDYLEEFQAPLNDFVKQVNTICAEGKIPVLPFKSGFALLFENQQTWAPFAAAFAATQRYHDRLTARQDEKDRALKLQTQHYMCRLVFTLAEALIKAAKIEEDKLVFHLPTN